ncbi:MAG: hypothetical protein KAW92_10525 [Candidatus Cloacimonetes bacterium]|nr:hypothetical protein [Candidatus Cloacimonadota bacterium]
MMKVKDLIEKLKRYNPEAETSVVVHNRLEHFSLTYGGERKSYNIIGD